MWRRLIIAACMLLVIVVAIAQLPSYPGEYVHREMTSSVVPSPVQYSVLLPKGYSEASEPLPLLLSLHGGGGTRNALKRLRPTFEEMWADGTLPPMVVVTPSVSKRGFYMDFRDGSEKWETFVVRDLLEHVRGTYNVRTDREGTLLTGISMGGMGSLRLAFKYPEVFGAVAAMEPGIEPVLAWEDVGPEHRWWRSDAIMEAAFGSPVDAEYWNSNNPAMIVHRNPERIRTSGLSIYIECGDEDVFGLYEGTEFLHRILYDNKIRHEYHLVKGADHVGRTILPRLEEALGFLAEYLEPTPQGVELKVLRKPFERMKARQNIKDHYEE